MPPGGAPGVTQVHGKERGADDRHDVDDERAEDPAERSVQNIRLDRFELGFEAQLGLPQLGHLHLLCGTVAGAARPVAALMSDQLCRGEDGADDGNDVDDEGAEDQAEDSVQDFRLYRFEPCVEAQFGLPQLAAQISDLGL